MPRLLLFLALSLAALPAAAEDSLYKAAERGDNAAVTKFVENGVVVNSSGGAGATEGWTPLHAAAFFGHLDVVHELLFHRADVSLRTPKGSTPLYLAAQAGRLEIVRLLLDVGADPAAANGRGKKPADVACELWRGKKPCPKREIVGALNGARPLNVRFVSAAQSSNWEAARGLLAEGADVNGKGAEGLTALHAAVQQGNFGMTKFLVESGARVDVYDSLGRPPLYIAASKGDLALVKYLISKGATSPEDGYTPEGNACGDWSGYAHAAGEACPKQAILDALKTQKQRKHRRVSDCVLLETNDVWKSWYARNFPDVRPKWPPQAKRELGGALRGESWTFVGKGDVDRDGTPTVLLLRLKSPPLSERETADKVVVLKWSKRERWSQALELDWRDAKAQAPVVGGELTLCAGEPLDRDHPGMTITVEDVDQNGRGLDEAEPEEEFFYSRDAGSYVSESHE